ncbi:SDR family NAD(P)-dependent oxidoreductase [Alicyclobacillus suci]|uniref:SDR family NAD(P)-dependent oxidoreductase n=1 Tax=Alicyclobacillus suci TaxID=2816080 RepID=UPI001A908AE4|nr:SDR family oxidoreductase [Alicyclobacillus suci]
MMEFAKKRVVITGAAGVLGSWIAEAFAGQGAALCLSDIRSDALEARLAQSSILSSATTIVHATDLTSNDSIQSLVSLVETHWKSPDVVVNNAGIYPSRLLMDMTNEEWHQVLGVNLDAPFQLTKAFSRLMIDTGIKGCFVNMTSLSATRPRVGAAHYAVSKAGLSMLTRAFALELARHEIRVNAVSPGFAPGSHVSLVSEDYVAAMTQTIPLGRTSGPKDAPEAILFLCSERASYITGTTLVVDGGSSAGNYQLPVSKP